MTEYFSEQNFVYWTIGFIVSMIWTKLLVNRMYICANRKLNSKLTIIKIIIDFLIWPILLIGVCLVELVFLIFPAKFLNELKED